MFIILYIIISLIILLITYTKNKTIIRPNIFFTLIWATSASLSSLGLYGLYKPANIVHFYSLLTIVSFNFFYLISGKKYKQNLSILKNQNLPINTKLIVCFNIILSLFMFRLLSRSIPIILSGGLNVLRLYAFKSDMGLFSTLELIIAQNIILPVYNATLIIGLFCFFKRKHFFIFFISIINVILYTLAFAGRGMITTIILYSIIYVYLFSEISFRNLLKSIKKFMNVRNMSMIGIGLIVLVRMTTLRGWGDVNFIEQIYLYTVAPFVFLSEVLESSPGGVSTLLFGKATFGFFVNIILMGFTFVFSLDYRGSDYLITSITDPIRYISPTQTYNALTTMIYPFLLDFGVLGIIFGTMIFAFAINFSERKYKMKGSYFYFFLYCYLCVELFNSVKNYYLLFPSSGVLIIMLLLFTHKLKFR